MAFRITAAGRCQILAAFLAFLFFGVVAYHGPLLSYASSFFSGSHALAKARAYAAQAYEYASGDDYHSIVHSMQDEAAGGGDGEDGGDVSDPAAAESFSGKGDSPTPDDEPSRGGGEAGEGSEGPAEQVDEEAAEGGAGDRPQMASDVGDDEPEEVGTPDPPASEESSGDGDGDGGQSQMASDVGDDEPEEDGTPDPPASDESSGDGEGDGGQSQMASDVGDEEPEEAAGIPEPSSSDESSGGGEGDGGQSQMASDVGDEEPEEAAGIPEPSSSEESSGGGEGDGGQSQMASDVGDEEPEEAGTLDETGSEPDEAAPGEEEEEEEGAGGDSQMASDVGDDEPQEGGGGADGSGAGGVEEEQGSEEEEGAAADDDQHDGTSSSAAATPSEIDDADDYPSAGAGKSLGTEEEDGDGGGDAQHEEDGGVAEGGGGGEEEEDGGIGGEGDTPPAVSAASSASPKKGRKPIGGYKAGGLHQPPPCGGAPQELVPFNIRDSAHDPDRAMVEHRRVKKTPSPSRRRLLDLRRERRSPARRSLLHTSRGSTVMGTGCNKAKQARVEHENDGAGPVIRKNVRPSEAGLSRCLTNIDACTWDVRAPARAMLGVRLLDSMSARLRQPGLSRRYRTCAIVGNAGHLAVKKYGEYIDRHDVVVRFNLQPTGSFWPHVGNKTTLRVVNHRRSLSACCRGTMPEARAGDKDVGVMVWFPAAQGEILGKCKEKFPSNPRLAMGRGLTRAESDVMRQLRKDAMRMGATGFSSWMQMTSGAHAILLFSNLCDQVSLYGMTTYKANNAGGADQYAAILAGGNKGAVARSRSGAKWHDWKGEKSAWKILHAAGRAAICSM